LTVNGLKHCRNPLLKAFLRRLHRLAIDPGGRARLWCTDMGVAAF
jgi:hypothetical protein